RYGDKRAVQGQVLPDDHPLHRRYVGQRVADASRNPVRYVEGPDLEPTTCACGCGTDVAAGRIWAPGHDQKAVHARITAQWGGVLGFIQWFDATYPNADGAAA